MLRVQVVKEGTSLFFAADSLLDFEFNIFLGSRNSNAPSSSLAAQTSLDLQRWTRPGGRI
jgi:hypothetical protein